MSPCLHGCALDLIPTVCTVFSLKSILTILARYLFCVHVSAWRSRYQPLGGTASLEAHVSVVLLPRETGVGVCCVGVHVSMQLAANIKLV